MNRFTTALTLAILALLAFAATVFGQTGLDDLTDTPTSAMLANVAGIAGLVAILLNLLRGRIPAETFDDWAPVMAVVLGVALSLLGAFQRHDPLLLDAALVGLYGGVTSQLANTVVSRTIRAVKS